MPYQYLIAIGLTGALLGILAYLNRCAHDWQPVVERELPSRLEEAKKSGVSVSYFNEWRIQSMPKKIYFAIIACRKCGCRRIFKVKT